LGKKLKNIKGKETKYFFHTYNRLDTLIEYGNGCYLIDSNGRKILDMFGGLAVNLLGYNNKLINRAAINQITKFSHISNIFYQFPQIKLAEELIRLSGFNKVFFTNSGTEAAEAAIKIVRKYFFGQKKKEVIAFENSFHGRTLGALSITEKQKYRKYFEPLFPGVKFIQRNDDKSLYKNISKNTAAVFLEFIQGEGGVNIFTSSFIKELFILRDKYKFLIIADEIQSGLGRTGKFFSFEHFKVKPDIILLAKGLGGGLPLGAVIGNEKVENVFNPGDHGSTFGGNPVSCSAGISLLDQLNESLLKRVSENSKYLFDKLKNLQSKHPGKIKDIRGLGYMIGIEMCFDAKSLVEKFLNENILVNCTNDNVIRLLPPLIMTRKHFNMFLATFSKILESL
jgi:acetylornithine/N-succinyldiaminopimelate aminotransferase